MKSIKHCSWCDRDLAIENFYIKTRILPSGNKSRFAGAYCKKCTSQYIRIRAKEQRDELARLKEEVEKLRSEK